MTLFRLDASIRVEGSTSREIADIVEEEWLAANPGDRVVRRHLGTDPLPADAWAAAVSGQPIPPEDRTLAQRSAAALAATLADEMIEADAIVLAVPLYNFGPSQHIKTWIDLLFTDPRTGVRSEFLKGKQVVLVAVRGGAYGPGTPRHGWDHSTGYLERILRDVWLADLTVVEREFTFVGVKPELAEFTEMGAQMHADARDAARQAGRALGVVAAA